MRLQTRRQPRLVLTAALASALAASGCSSINDALSGDKIDYRTSGSQSVHLDVPPDLSQLPGQSRYGQVQSSVSATSLMRNGDKPEASPTNAVAPTEAGGVKLERQGQARWLAVNLPPEQIWSKVESFWTDMGFELKTDKPEIGIMETNWAENKAKVNNDGIIRQSLGRVFDMLHDTGERDMYRTRIERTTNGSEIYISHRGLSEEYEDPNRKDRTTWRARPADPGLEAEMLSRLMIKLGAPKESAVVAKAPEAPAAPQAAAFAHLNPDGESLTLDVDYDTAWRRVGLALDRSGFTVENRDRKQGVYEVRLSDEDAEANKPGFFARLFGASTKDDGLSRYRVVVQGDGRSSSTVTVLDEKGQHSNPKAAKRIAKQLIDELI